MDKMERRSFALELRQDRSFGGIAVSYSDEADIGGAFKERFKSGCIELRDPTLNLQHRRELILARQDRGLAFDDNADRLAVSVDLPKTRIADDALDLINAGLLAGFSVEFVCRKEDWDESGSVPVRTVLQCEIHGLAVVDKPAFPKSTLQREAKAVLEARAKVELPRKRWFI